MDIITKIKRRITKYRTGKSVFSIITDILLLVLIILMLIPYTRQPLIVGIKKATMLQPRIKAQSENYSLSSKDYDWIIQDASGNLYHFNQFKGKVVFLSFWATYCPSCIAEFESIKNLYDHYGKDVVFLLVSSERPAAIESFLKKGQYNIPFYLTYGKVPDILHSRLIPSTFIIDREGNILVQKTGTAKWDGNKVKTLLDSLLKE